MYTSIYTFHPLANPSQFKSPEFLTSFTDVTVPYRTEQVIMHCKVVGVPTPVVRFYRDGKLIRPEATNGRIKIGTLLFIIYSRLWSIKFLALANITLYCACTGQNEVCTFYL